MAVIMKGVIWFVLGGILRFILILNAEKLSWILSNVAVSTPLNSWTRVTEGINLLRNGISPYSGDIYHETPFLLFILEFLTRNSDLLMPFLFVACDLITALTLAGSAYQFCKDLMRKQNGEKQTYSPDSKKLLLKPGDIERIPTLVAIMYLFHPYSVVSCCAMTTTVFANCILSAGIFLMSKGWLLSCVFLALATYQNLYPAILILPCARYIAQKRYELSKSLKRITTFSILTVALYLLSFGFLLFASSVAMGNWNFLYSVYGCILNVNDLTPNIGLFWYFFTEMFDHFHDFFICAFQINAFIYVIPLMIRFRKDNVIVIFTLMGLMCIFKSYPSVGDIALYMALLPIWSHLYPYMRQTFIIGCFFLACSALAPVQYHMWIYAGSANANFFFGTTLAFNTAQIFLITDIAFAYVKRECHLIKGPNPMINGKPGKLVLE